MEVPVGHAIGRFAGQALQYQSMSLALLSNRLNTSSESLVLLLAWQPARGLGYQKRLLTLPRRSAPKSCHRVWRGGGALGSHGRVLGTPASGVPSHRPGWKQRCIFAGWECSAVMVHGCRFTKSTLHQLFLIQPTARGLGAVL